MLQIVKGETKAKITTINGKHLAEFKNGLAVALTAETGGAKFVATNDGHLR